MKQAIPLNQKFKVELIDNIVFNDINTMQNETCESYDDDCGRCGHFNFSVTDNELRFYYGDYPRLGFYDNNKCSLVRLFHVARTPDNFTETGIFQLEKSYPIPKTMCEFVILLHLFIELSYDTCTYLFIEFYEAYMNINPDYKSESPIPF
jgi:hypothetical protein